MEVDQAEVACLAHSLEVDRLVGAFAGLVAFAVAENPANLIAEESPVVATSAKKLAYLDFAEEEHLVVAFLVVAALALELA